MPYKFKRKEAKASLKTGAVATPMEPMKKFILAAAALLMAGGAAIAASAVNRDSEPRTLVVTEGGSQSELIVGPGETVEFCSSGCFVTMPNGDREVLTGSERIEISGGTGRIR
ncbi:hypothetical protein SAMN05216176_101391 [Nitratireductor indicus]|nr:hypothetical protein SAMN05216176_101391 [Nitratireductor indicus]